jgi:phenylalanyl-tRNA synthetase beta chain
MLQEVSMLRLITPSVSNFRVDKERSKLMMLKDAKLAPRYCGVTISGIEVKPSPRV